VNPNENRRSKVSHIGILGALNAILGGLAAVAGIYILTIPPLHYGAKTPDSVVTFAFAYGIWRLTQPEAKASFAGLECSLGTDIAPSRSAPYGGGNAGESKSPQFGNGD
jgi:hypothetical protein